VRHVVIRRLLPFFFCLLPLLAAAKWAEGHRAAATTSSKQFLQKKATVGAEARRVAPKSPTKTFPSKEFPPRERLP